METITFELGEKVPEPTIETIESLKRSYAEGTLRLKTSHTRLLLRILGEIDKRSLKMLEGKKIDDSELEKLIVVGIISLKAQRLKLEQQFDESFKLYQQDRADLFEVLRR